MWTRFVPSFAAAAATAASGEVGRIVHVRTDHGFDSGGSPARLTDPLLAGTMIDTKFATLFPTGGGVLLTQCLRRLQGRA